jgi:hypothetical protein
VKTEAFSLSTVALAKVDLSNETLAHPLVRVLTNPNLKIFFAACHARRSGTGLSATIHARRVGFSLQSLAGAFHLLLIKYHSSQAYKL